MATSLSMSYEDMKTQIAALKQQKATFESTTTAMSKSVTTLCDGWTAQASKIYRDDYNKLAKNFKSTKEVLEKLIASTSKYVEDMQNLDKAYSKSKVQ